MMLPRFRHTAPLAVAAVLLATMQVAAAQGMVDPTRPSGMPPPGQAAAAPAPDPGPPSAQILVTGASRQFVMIDGQTVYPGQVFNGSRLVSVGPEGPVWQKGTARERPSMNPAAKKSVASAEAPRDTSPGKKKTTNGESR